MHIEYEPVDPRESKIFQETLAQMAKLKRIPSGLTVYPFRVPVYRLTVDEVEKGTPQLAHGLVVWRYFAGRHVRNFIVCGDINITAPIPVNNLSYGDAAYRTFSALADLKTQNPGDGGIYSPQYLQIPGALFESIRLEPAPVAKNIAKDATIMPYHTLIPGFREGPDITKERRRYTEDELYAQLRRVLEDQVKRGHSRMSSN